MAKSVAKLTVVASNKPKALPKDIENEFRTMGETFGSASLTTFNAGKRFQQLVLDKDSPIDASHTDLIAAAFYAGKNAKDGKATSAKTFKSELATFVAPNVLATPEPYAHIPAFMKANPGKYGEYQWAVQINRRIRDMDKAPAKVTPQLTAELLKGESSGATNNEPAGDDADKKAKALRKRLAEAAKALLALKGVKKGKLTKEQRALLTALATL